MQWAERSKMARRSGHSFSWRWNVAVDRDDAAITLAISQWPTDLGLRVIAEGVETEEQLAFLTAHGCDEAQGYLLTRPITAEERTTMLCEQTCVFRSPHNREG